MQIRFTVLGPHADQAPADVLVTAPTGTLFGAVAGALRTASGISARRFWAGETRLDDDTPLGVPPLVDGALLTADQPGAASPAPGPAELRVVAGPDAGGVHLLRQGSARVGRAVDAEIRLGDPDLSRLHAEIGITPGRLTVRDLGSTNGTTLDGVPVGTEPVTLRPGAVLRAGESTLVAVPPHSYVTDGAPRIDGMGHVGIPRASGPVPPLPDDVLLATDDSGPARKRPLVGRRRAAESAKAALDERVRAALLEEFRRLGRRAPDAAAVLLAALGTTSGRRPEGARIWERTGARPGTLALRVGIGDLPSSVGVTDDSGTRHLTSYGVPVTVGTAEDVTGIAGPRRRLLGTARWVVAQAAALVAPQDLDIVLLCADPAAAADWAWVRWLPHLRPQDGQDCRLLVGLTRDQIQARTAELLDRTDAAGTQPVTRRTLVVLDGAGSLSRRDDVARLLTEGPAAGVHALCLDDRAEELPLQCSVIARVTGEVGTRLQIVGPGSRRLEDVVADAVSPAWADRFARALAPLRETTSRTRAPLPDTVRQLDLLGMDLLTPAKILSGWQAQGESTLVTVGADARGPVTADLAADGPHVVVGGAAGSGRSELLTALVSSLAVRNRPDRLAVALVTGPGPVAGLAALPHTVGHLESPDPRQAYDAVTAVFEELDRRRDVLRGAPFTTQLLPRLVIAVDDADVISAHNPAFAKALAEIAHHGGPLGVHLVIAAHTADLEAAGEAELRIALRVDDAQVSRGLVEVEDAAVVAQEHPGRGLLRGADGAVIPFQAGRVTGRMPRTATLRPTVVRQDWTDLGNPLARRPAQRVAGAPEGGPTDLALLVGAVARAAEQLASPQTSPLWPAREHAHQPTA